jgi:hypothetical protein
VSTITEMRMESANRKRNTSLGGVSGGRTVDLSPRHDTTRRHTTRRVHDMTPYDTTREYPTRHLPTRHAGYTTRHNTTCRVHAGADPLTPR